jgi:hypothetical protein
MPLGALLGTGSLLGTVGAKSDPPMAGAPSSAEMAGESHVTLKTNSVNVPNKKGSVMWAFVKGFDSEAAKPHQPGDRCGSRGLNLDFTEHGVT